MEKDLICIDTNIIVYSLDASSPHYLTVKLLFQKILKEKIKVVVSQQNILEALSVFAKYYKKDLKEVLKAIDDILAAFDINIIFPTPITYMTFVNLVEKSKKKIDIFDYYLASTMIDNKIKKIYTMNEKDFLGLGQIEAINPNKI